MCSWLYSSSIFHENNLRKSSNIIPVHTAVVCSEEIISQTIIFRLSLLLPFSLFLDRCQNTFSSADLDFLPSSFNCHWRCHCGDFQAFLKLKYCLDISTRTCLRRRNFCWTILLYSNSSVAFFSIPSLSLVEIDEEQDEDWGKKFKRYQKKKFCRVLLLLPRTVYECKLLFAMHFPFKHLQTKNFSVSNRSRESAFEELRKYCINWPDSKELFCFYEIENRFLMFLFVCDSQFSWKQALNCRVKDEKGHLDKYRGRETNSQQIENKNFSFSCCNKK